MISFIVSALNEEKNVANTARTIAAAADACGVDHYEIIIIDDGSTDGTYAAMTAIAANNPSIVLLRNAHNIGVGSAIRQGIVAARYPRFLIVPGDNDMGQALIELLLTYRDKADLILTIRVNTEARSPGRNIISMIYQSVQMITFDVHVSYMNGPGVWPTEKARAVGLKADRFGIFSELNVKLLRSGCSYAELPAYFNSAPKGRRTVTLKNLWESIRLLAELVYEVYVTSRDRYSARPRRVKIDFLADARNSGVPTRQECA
jgi:glycosyltransferase involved in cell wall biosynthesis